MAKKKKNCKQYSEPIQEQNRSKMLELEKGQLIDLLVKANKRRKRESRKWKRVARWYIREFIRSRDSQSRDYEYFLKEREQWNRERQILASHEEEWRQWKDRADKLARNEIIEKAVEWMENNLCCYIGAQDFTIEHTRLESDFRKSMETE